MRERAYIKNENTGSRQWFVYVESERGDGAVYACRFESAHNAQAVADAINDAFRLEGRYLIHE